LKIYSDYTYKKVKKTTEYIDVCKVHNVFTVLEAIQSEDIGVFKKDEGAKAAHEGLTEIYR